MLNAIEEQATTLAVPALADLLLGLMAGFHDERAAVAALIESRQETSARGLELKHGLRSTSRGFCGQEIRRLHGGVPKAWPWSSSNS